MDCKARSAANQVHIKGPSREKAPRIVPYLAAAFVKPACAACKSILLQWKVQFGCGQFMCLSLEFRKQ